MTLKEDDCFHNQYYKYIYQLLATLGLWPNLKRSKRLIYNSFYSIMLLTGINSQIYLLVIVILEPQMELISVYLQTILPTFLFATAYWNLIFNSALVKEILEHVKNDWNMLTNEDELNIMKTYASQSKVASMLIICAFVLYITLLCLPSIIQFFLYITGAIDTTKATIPVPQNSLTQTTFVYYFIFLLEMAIILTTTITGIGYYILLITLLQHACALFVIVTNKIEQPFKKNSHKFAWTKPKQTKREAEFEWIVTVAKQYNKAINFFDLITSLYGKMYIVELSMFFTFIILNLVYFFQIFNLMLTAIETLKICCYINGSMLVIYAFFYLGERLMEHTSSVYAKCLMVPFYTLSADTNKLLLLFIMRSTRPCNISLKGTAVVSHEFFAKILKASFSFVTVFNRVR